MNASISTLESLIDALATTPDAELVFVAEGQDVRPGYHVTEVKFAHVRGLDCGRQRDE